MILAAMFISQCYNPDCVVKYCTSWSLMPGSVSVENKIFFEESLQEPFIFLCDIINVTFDKWSLEQMNQCLLYLYIIIFQVKNLKQSVCR